MNGLFNKSRHTTNTTEEIIPGMRKSYWVVILLTALIGLTVSACSRYELPDSTYICVRKGGGHIFYYRGLTLGNPDYLGSVGDKMQFSSDGTCAIPGRTSKYKLQGDYVELTEIGAPCVGQIHSDRISFEYDGSLWEKQ